MVTTVGLELDFMKALKNLVSLDYDAVEAYQAAIDRMEDEEYKKALESFKQDHLRHIEEISEFLRKHNETPPEGPSSKSLLTQGKVVLAKLVSERMILRAMRSNEIDTNTAYGRINNYEEIPDEIRGALKRDLQDEKRHLVWLEKTLES